MDHHPMTRGFTFIEILIVLAVMGILTTVSVSVFRNVYRDSAERIAAVEIINALRDARNKTLSAEDDAVYGVRVGTSSVTRFVGDAFIAGSPTNEVYVFEGGVTATGTMVQNATDIVFRHLTGEPSATGTISVHDIDTEGTRTITLSGAGLVE